MQIRTQMILFSVFAASILLQPLVVTGQTGVRSPYSQGVYRFYDGMFAEAEPFFVQAAKADPTDPRPHFFQGLCRLRQGDEKGATDSFQKGAYLENTAKGRLFNTSGALSRIQGSERVKIEEVRRAGRIAWRKLEEQKQIKRFGETVERQKAMISEETRIARQGGQMRSPQSANTQGSTSSLPSFAPIRPYTERGEAEVAKVPNLSDENNEEFEFFRDEIGKTSRSTAEQARLKELESRIEYKDPMDRPAKDGQKFVNIYDPGAIFVDEEPFFGADDPDDAYKEFESNPITSSTWLLETMIVKAGGKLSPVGTPKKGKKTAPGGMTPDPGMGPDPMMGGDPGMGGEPGMEGAPMDDPGLGGEGAPEVKVTVDVTDTLFKGGKDDNPFADKKVAVPNPASSLNLFADDLGFTAAPAQPAQGTEPGMGPEGGPPPDGPPGGPM